MPRGNGGVLGPANIPTTSVAKGVWSLMEQQLAQRQGIWPIVLSGDPYFEYTTLLLPGNGTNGAQNNTFLDGSTNNFTITRNGNTTQGTFSPFSQTGWGNYFDGSNDNVSTSSSTDLAAGSGAFTVEAWIFTADTSFMICASQTVGGLGFGYNIDNGTQGLWIGRVGQGVDATSGVQLTYNQWNHVAATRDASNNVKLFVNGTQVGSTTTVTSNYGTSAQGLYIGIDQNGTTFPLAGYISNLRYIKGQSILGTATSFTVPTSPLTSTTVGWSGTGVASSITGTVSLLTCQSNRFVDNSTTPKTLTPNNGPLVVAFSPFNPSASWSAATYGGSGYFDGNGDYLSAASNTAFNCGTDNFTVEVWVYITTRTLNYPAIISNNNGGFSAGAIAFTNSNSNGALDKFVLSVYDYGGAGRPLEASSTNDKNTWYHVAIVRDSSTTLKMYRNGLQVASQTISSGLTFDWGKSGLLVGGGNWDGANSYFNGYIQGLRLVKGTAVYTGEFTPPTKPLAISGADSAGSYPSTTNVNTSFASSATSLLLNYTNAGIYDATSKNDLETVGNAQISTAINNPFGLATGNMYFDGTGDYLTSPYSLLTTTFNGSFSIQLFVYFSVLPNTKAYGMKLAGAGSGAGTGWYLQAGNGSNIFNITCYGSGPNLTSTSTIVAGQWYHVAVARIGSNCSLYINGAREATTASGSGAIGNSALTSLFIGTYSGDATNSAHQLNGYISNYKSVNGYSEYDPTSTSITVPTAAFPTL